MKKYLYYALFILFCAVILVVGVSAGYRWYAGRDSVTEKENETAKGMAVRSGVEIAAIPASQSADQPMDLPEAEASIPVPVHEEERISPVTQMIYEYCYDDGRVETSREDAPYFLLDMTFEKLAGMFPDWEVTKFTEDEVIMRKYVPGKSAEYYIVGVQDGYVAVFYQQPVNGTSLKEITNTPVHTLSPDERQRLAEGIRIQGNDQLVKVMEDYGS